MSALGRGLKNVVVYHAGRMSGAPQNPPGTAGLSRSGVENKTPHAQTA